VRQPGQLQGSHLIHHRVIEIAEHKRGIRSEDQRDPGSIDLVAPHTAGGIVCPAMNELCELR